MCLSVSISLKVTATCLYRSSGHSKSTYSVQRWNDVFVRMYDFLNVSRWQLFRQSFLQFNGSPVRSTCSQNYQLPLEHVKIDARSRSRRSRNISSEWLVICATGLGARITRFLRFKAAARVVYYDIWSCRRSQGWGGGEGDPKSAPGEAVRYVGRVSSS